jgi:DNA invertase Pin-like site-specific DNA recombinase
MLIGYARISKTDGSQVLDLQYDALSSAGISVDHIYKDVASGKRDDRPGLSACLKALRQGDVLVVWKLDRLGRDLRHLVNTVQTIMLR